MAFSHEKLTVYQAAIRFVAWSQDLIVELPRVSARDQFERASTSIPLNIAEGSAKRSPRDRGRFWQIALGSTVECAACMDDLVAREIKTYGDVMAGKQQLEEIANMLVTLLNRLANYASEDFAEYGETIEQVLDQD